MTDTVTKLRSLALKLHHLGDGQLVNDASDVMGVAAIEIEKLREEIKRLRATNKQLVEGIDTITRRKQEEIERQRAENDRLRADLATQQSCCDGAAAQDAHVRREREEHRAEARLREVLRDIARKDYSDPFCELTPEGRARNALEGKP